MVSHVDDIRCLWCARLIFLLHTHILQWVIVRSVSILILFILVEFREIWYQGVGRVYLA